MEFYSNKNAKLKKNSLQVFSYFKTQIFCKNLGGLDKIKKPCVFHNPELETE